MLFSTASATAGHNSAMPVDNNHACGLAKPLASWTLCAPPWVQGLVPASRHTSAKNYFKSCTYSCRASVKLRVESSSLVPMVEPSTSSRSSPTMVSISAASCDKSFCAAPPKASTQCTQIVRAVSVHRFPQISNTTSVPNHTAQFVRQYASATPHRITPSPMPQPLALTYRITLAATTERL